MIHRWAILLVGLALAATAACRSSSTAPAGMPPDEHGPIPPRLSQTGVFKDVSALAPDDRLVAYEINAPFWSDGSGKDRWIRLPEGGSIGFTAEGPWTFPAGTILVKHFEVPVDTAKPDVMRRLETRLLVRDVHGGVYGVSYRWRADNSDADRVTQGTTESITVAGPSGERKQDWYYPSPADCRMCHTRLAGGVLGVTTRQLNKEVATSSSDPGENQLERWSRAGLFQSPLDPAQLADYPRLAALDDARAGLEHRARSWLDSNCSSCHQPGGAPGLFDTRYSTPLAKQNLVNGPVLINLTAEPVRAVAPGDPKRSMILRRIETLGPARMPPIGHEVVDHAGVELIRAWIESLTAPSQGPATGPAQARSPG